ncbi:SPOR domain-containing protein [Thauera aminoaromatica]|uniref:Sporulation domain protein n=3 Tax=Thauera aminoaromatica TaxID=164330 RepID=C4KBS3_THASP|nr:SPOR domain-containing protein [Thauera aminoaromatica]ACR02248.1 Sporulation domain protein [Thauera aminoaromatica]
MTTLRFLLILLLILNALAFAAIGGWLGGEPPAGEAGRIAAQLHPERIRLANETGATGLAPVAAEPPPPAAVVARAPSAPEATAAAPPDTTTGNAPARAATDDATLPAAQVAPEPAHPPAAEIAPAAEPPPPEPALVPAPSPAPPALCHVWADLGASEADRLAQRLRRIGITAARSRSETPEAWWVRIPPQRNRSEAERRVVELNLLGVSDTFIVQESGPNQNAVSLGLFKTENRARILLGQLRAKGVENAGIEPRMGTSYRIQANVPANELRIVESAAPGLRARRQACTR